MTEITNEDRFYAEVYRRTSMEIDDCMEGKSAVEKAKFCAEFWNECYSIEKDRLAKEYEAQGIDTSFCQDVTVSE